MSTPDSSERDAEPPPPVDYPRRPRRPVKDWPSTTTAAEERSLVRERIDGLHERLEDVIEDVGDVRAEMLDIRADQHEILRLAREQARATHRPPAVVRLVEQLLGEKGSNVRVIVIGLVVLALVTMGTGVAVSYGDLTLVSGSPASAGVPTPTVRVPPLPAPDDTDASVSP